jgi:hypothetical protein
MTNLAGHDLPTDRCLRQGRPRPADLLHRLHHQGLRAAVAGPRTTTPA